MLSFLNRFGASSLLNGQPDTSPIRIEAEIVEDCKKLARASGAIEADVDLLDCLVAKYQMAALCKGAGPWDERDPSDAHQTMLYEEVKVRQPELERAVELLTQELKSALPGEEPVLPSRSWQLVSSGKALAAVPAIALFKLLSVYYVSPLAGALALGISLPSAVSLAGSWLDASDDSMRVARYLPGAAAFLLWSAAGYLEVVSSPLWFAALLELPGVVVSGVGLGILGAFAGIVASNSVAGFLKRRREVEALRPAWFLKNERYRLQLELLKAAKEELEACKKSQAGYSTMLKERQSSFRAALIRADAAEAAARSGYKEGMAENQGDVYGTSVSLPEEVRDVG
jgi:hypothetical protein